MGGIHVFSVFAHDLSSAEIQANGVKDFMWRLCQQPPHFQMRSRSQVLGARTQHILTGTQPEPMGRGPHVEAAGQRKGSAEHGGRKIDGHGYYLEGSAEGLAGGQSPGGGVRTKARP